MRKVKHSVFIAVALAFVFGTFAVADADAQILNTILTRMQKHKDRLQSLKADVVMKETDDLLQTTDVTFGNTYYLPRKNHEPYVRINWTKPRQETLLVKDGKYILHQPHIKQAIVGKVSEANKSSKSNSSAFDFMNMSKAELKANYKIKKRNNEKIGGKEIWRLKLEPKKRKSYKYAEIWVDKDGMPIRMKLVERNNDSTTVSLSNIKKNVKNFNAGVFNLKLPKGTKIV